MIKITPQITQGRFVPDYAYIEGRKGIRRAILPLTRYLRAVNAERYIRSDGRLLDIGCGDGYFLKRSRCTEKYGLDKLVGDDVNDKLDFPDAFFDYVTMLAVIEHLLDPEALIPEIHRVLKPRGRLIFTTPRKEAEIFIRLYVRNIEDEHESYFTLPRVRELTQGLFEVNGYHTFIFGLNQAFCLEKIPAKNATAGAN